MQVSHRFAPLILLWAGLFGSTATALAQPLNAPIDYGEANIVPRLPLEELAPATTTHPPDWHLQVLPDGLIYKSYLAGVKESRMGAHLMNMEGDGWLMDGILGGRFGVFRYGSEGDLLPQGWQFDVEGSAHVRLDIPEDVDVRSADFRAGALITRGWGRQQMKFGYYHLSSHLGDEFLLKNLGFDRLNYAKDSLIMGYSIYPTDNLRLYAEAAWAFFSDVAEPWEFQFGAEWSPAYPTGPWGAPFVALNTYLREEVNFGGNFVAQAGWSWRSDRSGHLFRMGLHYYNGESSQFSFFDDFEHQIGFGIWYDF